MARSLSNLAYRWAVFVVGLTVAGLAGTGVYIWWRKRSARLADGKRYKSKRV